MIPRDIAYYKGFAEVLSAMTIFAANNNQPVKFTFDSREESDYHSVFLYKMFRERSEVNVSMFGNLTLLALANNLSFRYLIYGLERR